MKRKAISRIALVAISVLMLFATLLSVCTSSFGVNAASPTYISKYNGDLKSNVEQYFNSNVVQKLPSTVKNTDTISLIIDMDLPAIMDVYALSDKSMSMAEYASSNVAKTLLKESYSKKTQILNSLQKTGVKYTTGADYNTIFSGFEILIQACDFDTVCDAVGTSGTVMVGEVYEPADSQLVENDVNFYESTGIFDSSDFKYQGEGMVIAVLDTGLDYTHTAFLDSNFNADRNKLGLTKQMVADLLLAKETRAEVYMQGVTADDLYVSDKVPFAFDYADGDADVYSLHNNHGTHVSGVIAGKDDVITGVAPQAQIVSMKTFSDVEESARTSWILSALEDCVLLGVDVINMSLGTACGFSRESDKEAINGNVYQKIRDAGISLVVAASNSYNSAYGSDKNGNLGLTSNPDTSTVGSPSTYEGAMSVASINGKKTPYILYNDSIVYFVEATNASSKEKDFFEEILKDRIPADSNEVIDMEYVLVPGAGRPADYYGLDVKDKIVLVRRGSTTFEEKAQAAQNAGAAAIIIYNNVSGDIKMNAGTITIPICSISQDDGEMLAASKKGTIKISRSQTSGPFISDFSSWGPAPDLSIKPEITAHGGNILSAVTGGDYDRLSGTSMACPNMAGVIALMRQYVENEYESIKNMAEGADKSKATNALVNCLIMSTADIMYNTNGLPYAVRKQGAGLANLISASTTTAYIKTYDRLDGSVMDKSKIELGDDKEKTGVYTFKFAIDNFGSTSLTYNVSATVMTEGVSETETVRGETTVTEQGYMLNGAKFEILSVTGGTKNGNAVTVAAGSEAVVEARITLSDSDKKYLDESFENGMYVEGFVTLDIASGGTVDLSVPFLAFYGDWTKSPLFDTDYFETNKDELDDGISQDDKVMADAYATRPIGGLYSDYVSYLGSYYFQQNPNDKVIAASRDYIALSYSDETVHSFRFVWAGLLRNAAKIVITITNDATGEVIYQVTDYDIRKSYGDGGSIYPANIEVEFDTQDYDLPNNAQLSVKLEGYLDYGDGGAETNLKNTFEFPIVIDYEAPVITDCEFYTEYDKDLKKDRLFARVAVYDNHYAMSLNFGYVRKATDEEYAEDGYESIMESFESYLTPVYSTFNGTTYVEYELTDYIFDIKENAKNKNTFVVTCYDYALNIATYEIGLPAEYVDFYFEESANETNYLSVNQVYKLNPILYPNAETDPDSTDNPWGELITYQSTRPSVAKIVNDKIVAVSPGVTMIQAIDKATGKKAQFHVTVLGPEAKNDPELSKYYTEYDVPVADVFDVVGYETLKAYYYLNSDERDIGATGDVKMFDGGFGLKMFPSESVKLKTKYTLYFPDRAKIVYESNNTNVVEIDENGVVTAKGEGRSSVVVKILLDGKTTFFSETISVEVKKPWIRTGPSLTHYFGNGGTVTVPADLNLTEIGQFAFSNFDYVEKDENDEISEEDPENTKMVYIGEDTITKVILPIGIEKIGPYAFAGLTALEEIVIPYTVEAIEYGAFSGCTSLTTISYMDENGNITTGNGLKNVKLINMGAFQNCDLRGELLLDNARAIGDYAFAGNTRLSSVVIPATLQSIGGYAFFGDSGLQTVTVHADFVKYGPYVFAYCTSLKSMVTLDSEGNPVATINASVIPEGAFYGCTSLKKVTIGKDVNVIAEYAFGRSGVEQFSINENNQAFKVQSGEYILSKDETSLVLVAPTVSGVFQPEEKTIVSIATGAFAENKNVETVVLPNVTKVGKYAFAECSKLENVTLGTLTEIGEYSFFETSITTHPSFESVEKIGDYAFAFSKITDVTVPDGVDIGEGAFCECDYLKNITIGNDVNIGYGAFMYDNKLSGRWQMLFYEKNAKRHYYYDYMSPIESIVIGNNVVIGEASFMGASDIETITLGENIVIESQAFFNACSLKTILDHEGNDVGFKNVISIGDLAFTGDEQYVFSDAEGNNLMISNDNYVYYYYGAAFESIDLTGVESIGKGAFAYNTSLKDVVLGENMKEIPELAFFNCIKLENINLDKVEVVGNNSFANTYVLETVDLSSADKVDSYAFAYSGIKNLILNNEGTDIGECAFIYCEKLAEVENLGAAKNIGARSFMYTNLTEADLTNAETIGDEAFMKKEMTPFKVTLGEKLVSLGDNPFAFCKVEPFAQKTTYNDGNYVVYNYSYEISDTVKVVNGSLYCKVENGYELITYAGIEENGIVTVEDDTVRIGAYAFAGSDVTSVKLPISLNAVGHKAFYGCNKLVAVEFRSYEAPVLEEKLDFEYYNTYENIIGSGNYQIPLNNGTILEHEGLGIVDFYMWNVPSGMYYDVLFGANFVDNIGHIENKLIMIAPHNGVGYDTFTLNQYFDKVYMGEIAPTDETLAAIAAIEQLPRTIRLTHESLVIAAREAYDKIATKDQQALVTDYVKLQSAESKIQRLKAEQEESETPPVDGDTTPEKPTETPNTSVTPEPAKDNTINTVLLVLTIVFGVVAVGLGAFVTVDIIRRNKPNVTNEQIEEKSDSKGENEKTAEDDGDSSN